MNMLRRVIGDAGGAVMLVGILALALLPLPPLVLDLLISVSLCVGILVLLVTIYSERPLDFSSFPSVLVLVTLFRLALNLASTRVILLHGSEGTAAAGQVIHAFGDFAVGGNFVVGAVVFLILVIVNFVVITKGADRISEVGARFTLDSLPGKQMAIDSDLVAGLVDEAGARLRRREVQAEADFYGAMDGASKFVRGDAIAGLVIVAINVLAGIVIGVAQHGMSFGDATTTYTILSIGDGLVSQIPALLVSAGAALLVTRDGNGRLGNSVGSQLFRTSRPILTVAVVLGVIALVPGMPHVAMLSLAGVIGVVGWRKRPAAAPVAAKSDDPARRNDPAKAASAATPEEQKAQIEAVLPLDLLSLEIGVGLLPLVEGAGGGELVARIAGVRKQMALELGFIVPPVHVRDQLRIRPGAYQCLISGVKVGGGEVRPGRLLAIDPSARGLGGLQGEAVAEPTFGLPAKWIAATDRAAAESAGCTVVDPATVIATHLTEVIRRHASELLGRKEAQELLDIAGKDHGKVVEELVPHLMSLGEVIAVLRELLAEGVSIRDARTILETLADHASKSKDAADLTELVRARLGRQVTSQHVTASGELRALVLDPGAEDMLRRAVRAPDAAALNNLTRALQRGAEQAAARDESPVVVAAPDVRRSVAAIARRHVPGLSVLSYREIDPNVSLRTAGIVSVEAQTREAVA